MKLSLPWGGNRSVAQIVAGLSDMVTELETKTAACSTQIESCDTNKQSEVDNHEAKIQAETERHGSEMLRLNAVHSNLVNEQKSAETIAANLKGILGV